MARAVLTDIEGTTTSVRFVYDVLFPYARRELPDFLRRHSAHPEVAEQIATISDDVGTTLDLEETIAVLEQWMAEDRKATPLKTLQGLVWEQGYRDGALKGHVYPDAVAGLRRWHAERHDLYIYSSGSVQAQQLLFGYSEAGDLTPLFKGYFDTRVGHKREESAYHAILEQIGRSGGEVLFLSDIVEELDAAAAAGLATAWLVREGEGPVGARHPVHTSFETIQP